MDSDLPVRYNQMHLARYEKHSMRKWLDLAACSCQLVQPDWDAQDSCQSSREQVQ